MYDTILIIDPNTGILYLLHEEQLNVFTGCEKCNSGYYGCVECQKCEGGNYCVGDSPLQVACPGGFLYNLGITGMSNVSACEGAATSCPAGHYCPPGTVESPPLCPSGTYSSIGHTFSNFNECLECGSDSKYCPIGSSSPLLVPNGYCSNGNDASKRESIIQCGVQLEVTFEDELILSIGQSASVNLEIRNTGFVDISYVIISLPSFLKVDSKTGDIVKLSSVTIPTIVTAAELDIGEYTKTLTIEWVPDGINQSPMRSSTLDVTIKVVDPPLEIPTEMYAGIGAPVGIIALSLLL